MGLLSLCNHISQLLTVNITLYIHISASVLCSIVSGSVTPSATPSVRFPRQEHWSELPFPFPGGSYWSRDWTHISCIGRWILYHWAFPGVCIYINIHPLGSVSKESPNTELLAKSLISFVLWFSHLWDEKPSICLLCLVRTWLCVWWNEQIAQIHDTLERIMKSLRAVLCLTSLRKIHWTPTRHQHYPPDPYTKKPLNNYSLTCIS